MKKDKENEVPEKYREALQEVALQILSGEFSIKNYYGLTDDGLEAIYSVGHEFFSHKQYDKAKSVFSLLLVLEPSSIRYMTACGSACFMAEQYDNALEFFSNVLAAGDYTPKTILRAAECAIRLEKFEQTENLLNELIELAKKKEFKDDKDSQICLTRATMMLQLVKNQIEESKKADEASKQADGEEKPSDGQNPPSAEVMSNSESESAKIEPVEQLEETAQLVEAVENSR